MSSNLGVMSNLGILVPAVESRTTEYNRIYEENRHRIYSLAFWMTDNELTAEGLSANVFLRAFAGSARPTAEQIDDAFLAEVRETVTLGALTLHCAATTTPSMHRNVKRVHLERAVVQLPATEKLIFLMHDVEGYDHQRIARLLGIEEQESQYGLHQARVLIRELVSQMS
ncbi:MAG TPA: sigma factor-like helix-turn-helix DNA-binding protein [Candidatus Angelobacter sp.]|nr:sigma factor-like helix-turn-helix DNA-binding protein [Candidatus Angelobacter sp.]